MPQWIDVMISPLVQHLKDIQTKLEVCKGDAWMKGALGDKQKDELTVAKEEQLRWVNSILTLEQARKSAIQGWSNVLNLVESISHALATQNEQVSSLLFSYLDRHIPEKSWFSRLNPSVEAYRANVEFITRMNGNTITSPYVEFNQNLVSDRLVHNAKMTLTLFVEYFAKTFRERECVYLPPFVTSVNRYKEGYDHNNMNLIGNQFTVPEIGSFNFGLAPDQLRTVLRDLKFVPPANPPPMPVRQPKPQTTPKQVDPTPQQPGGSANAPVSVPPIVNPSVPAPQVNQTTEPTVTQPSGAPTPQQEPVITNRIISKESSANYFTARLKIVYRSNKPINRPVSPSQTSNQTEPIAKKPIAHEYVSGNRHKHYSYIDLHRSLSKWDHAKGEIDKVFERLNNNLMNFVANYTSVNYKKHKIRLLQYKLSGNDPSVADVVLTGTEDVNTFISILNQTNDLSGKVKDPSFEKTKNGIRVNPNLLAMSVEEDTVIYANFQLVSLNSMESVSGFYKQQYNSLITNSNESKNSNRMLDLVSSIASTAINFAYDPLSRKVTTPAQIIRFANEFVNNIDLWEQFKSLISTNINTKQQRYSEVVVQNKDGQRTNESLNNMKENINNLATPNSSSLKGYHALLIFLKYLVIFIDHNRVKILECNKEWFSRGECVLLLKADQLKLFFTSLKDTLGKHLLQYMINNCAKNKNCGTEEAQMTHLLQPFNYDNHMSTDTK
jgi:hypothetical protein